MLRLLIIALALHGAHHAHHCTVQRVEASHTITNSTPTVNGERLPVVSTTPFGQTYADAYTRVTVTLPLAPAAGRVCVSVTTRLQYRARVRMWVRARVSSH